MRNIARYLLVISAVIFFTLIATVKIYPELSPFPKISQWNYHQLKRIDKSKREFSFVVFGDNRGSVELFPKLLKKVDEENALFAVHNGDLVDNGEKERYRLFINQIKKMNTPLLIVIGNHELKKNGRGLYYDLFGRFYYSFTVGDSYFILLDNANWRNIDPWQMDWLKKELEKSKDYRYRFVFMHVPLYDPRKGKNQKGHSLKDLNFAKKLNALLDRYEITMLFASHIHGYYKGVWGKTPYIITGGAGAPLEEDRNPKHYFYHYIRVTVRENGVNYQVVRISPPRYEALSNFLYALWMKTYIALRRNFWQSIAIFVLAYLVIFSRMTRKR